MDVKEAVGLAKKHVLDLFADDRRKVWHITIGFSRPWEREFGAISFPPPRAVVTPNTLTEAVNRSAQIAEPIGPRTRPLPVLCDRR